MLWLLSKVGRQVDLGCKTGCSLWAIGRHLSVYVGYKGGPWNPLQLGRWTSRAYRLEFGRILAFWDKVPQPYRFL